MQILYQELLIRGALFTDSAQLAAWWTDGAVMAHAGFPDGTVYSYLEYKLYRT